MVQGGTIREHAPGTPGGPVRINPGLAAFRRRYRAELPAGYSGARHLTLVALSCTGAVVASLEVLEDPSGLEWLTVPLTFLAANLVEYHAHRGPMHHPVPGLGLVYRRHVHQHHRFFRGHAMGTDSSRDNRVVLFPLVLLGFFFGLVALPVGAALLALAGTNSAALFVATVALYYLSYECLHYAVHAPPGHRVRAVPGIGWLRDYHRRHHDPRWMSQVNFNITYPIADCLHRTARFSDPDRHR